MNCRMVRCCLKLPPPTTLFWYQLGGVQVNRSQELYLSFYLFFSGYSVIFTNCSHNVQSNIIVHNITIWLFRCQHWWKWKLMWQETFQWNSFQKPFKVKLEDFLAKELANLFIYAYFHPPIIHDVIPPIKKKQKNTGGLNLVTILLLCCAPCNSYWLRSANLWGCMTSTDNHGPLLLARSCSPGCSV